MAARMLPTEHTVLRAFAAARWVVWAWLVLLCWVQRDELSRPWWAALTLAAALSFTVASTMLLRRQHPALLRPAWAVADLGLAFTLLVADGLVYERGHAFGAAQNLAGNWPFLSAVTAAVAVGPRAGALGGIVVALGRAAGAWANDASFGRSELTSIGGTIVAYGIAGATLGWMAARLREVETVLAARRARDEVAATLHDGVLQTLAVVARRSATTLPDVAALARRTDRELRLWLFGGGDDDTDLEAALRRAAQDVGLRHDLPVTVSVVADGAAPPAGVIAAVGGAVREAVTNAAKHAGAAKVVVFAEVDDDGALFVSVHDDGCGFDPAQRGGGVGIEQSINRRIAEVGGRVELDSAPGRGTEVKLWVP
ncbi:MAG: sensor histidine kinase [Acidimicrobiia bacterium]